MLVVKRTILAVIGICFLVSSVWAQGNCSELELKWNDGPCSVKSNCSDTRTCFEAAFKASKDLLTKDPAVGLIANWIGQRKNLMVKPSNEGFEGIKFMIQTHKFKKNASRTQFISANEDPGIGLLPNRIIRKMNDAIKRAYNKGFYRFGDFKGFGDATYETISTKAAGDMKFVIRTEKKAHFIRKYPRLAGKPALQEEIEAKFNEHSSMLQKAKAFFEKYTEVKKSLWGIGPKVRVFKASYKSQKKELEKQWKGYLKSHKTLLAEERQLINKAVEAIKQYHRFCAKEVFAGIADKFGNDRMSAKQFISQLPQEWRRNVENRIRRAFIDGVKDGAKAAISYRARTYTWKSRGSDGNIYRHTAYRYTAYWSGDKDYSWNRWKLLTPFCTYPSCSVNTNEDGSLVQIKFTVLAPDDSYPKTRYINIRPFHGMSQDFSFLNFFDAAVTIAAIALDSYDYISYGDNLGSSWGSSWGSSYSDYSESSWNNPGSGTQGWNDSKPYGNSTGSNGSDSPGYGDLNGGSSDWNDY